MVNICDHEIGDEIDWIFKEKYCLENNNIMLDYKILNNMMKNQVKSILNIYKSNPDKIIFWSQE